MNWVNPVDLHFSEKFYVKQINEDYSANILQRRKANLVIFIDNFQLPVAKN